MATHDYVIANQSGAAFRSDLNNALAAIVSNNSNSSSPATTYAYQWWADTSANILKIRNSNNNGWINVRELDGTTLLADGSASEPGLCFSTDTDTGIFRSAANTFNIATAGVERMELGGTTIFNESGADVDFRIEGDTLANLFYLDAGNDRIGINTSSPSHRLDISQDGVAFPSAAGSTVVRIRNSAGSSTLSIDSNAGNAGAIQFGDTDAASRGTLSYNHSTNSMQINTNATERLRVDSSGRL